MGHKPKIRAKIKKLLKENIEEKFCELRLGKSQIGHGKHKLYYKKIRLIN